MYKIQSVQDQQLFAVPINLLTETLFYNHRMIIDSVLFNSDAQPRAWLISKVNRLSPNGIVRVTLTQDLFDQNNDYIERDDSGNIVGMWANYYNNIIDQPQPVAPDDTLSGITSQIICSGKPQIRVGGSSKTFTVTYKNANGEIMNDITPGDWSFAINGNIALDNLFDLTPLDGGYKIKVKFLGDDSYIGSILTITNTALGDVTSSLNIGIEPL